MRTPTWSARSIQIAAVAAGIAGFALAASGQAIGVPLALLALFFSASTLGRAGKYARELAPLRTTQVTVRLWGTAPEGGLEYSIQTIFAVGAGLHIRFERAGGDTAHLKIAQPDGFVRSDDEIRITAARYLQWDGRTVSKDGSTPAVVITVVGGP